MPITALVKGVSHRYLTATRAPEWRVSGNVVIKEGTICGLKEGSGRVRAALGGVWSPEVEVSISIGLLCYRTNVVIDTLEKSCAFLREPWNPVT